MAHYNSIDTQVAKRFLAEVHHQISLIKKNPHVFGIKYRNVRTITLERFPFLIHYYIENTCIKVIGVIHTLRDSIIWDKRKL